MKRSDCRPVKQTRIAILFQTFAAGFKTLTSDMTRVFAFYQKRQFIQASITTSRMTWCILGNAKPVRISMSHSTTSMNFVINKLKVIRKSRYSKFRKRKRRLSLIRQWPLQIRSLQSHLFHCLFHQMKLRYKSQSQLSRILSQSRNPSQLSLKIKKRNSNQSYLLKKTKILIMSQLLIQSQNLSQRLNQKKKIQSLSLRLILSPSLKSKILSLSLKKKIQNLNLHLSLKKKILNPSQSLRRKIQNPSLHLILSPSLKRKILNPSQNQIQSLKKKTLNPSQYQIQSLKKKIHNQQKIQKTMSLKMMIISQMSHQRMKNKSLFKKRNQYLMKNLQKKMKHPIKMMIHKKLTIH